MKVHNDLKELLDEYTSQYLIRCSSPKTNTLQEFIDDFASSNSLALGKPEPLAKNKQFDKVCNNCRHNESLKFCHRCDDELSHWES